MILSVKTLPPGSITIFTVEVDNFGNETYVGGPVTYGGLYATSDGNDGGQAGGYIPPSYATPPDPYKSTVVDKVYAEEPGGRNLQVALKDGFSLEEAKLNSVEIVPRTIEGTDWINVENVRKSDDNNAQISALTGDYCNQLILSDFGDIDIPSNASIKGIRVTVERSKMTP